MFEGFLQDSWKVNTKLRLELGIRYTIMQPYYYSLWRNMAVFDPEPVRSGQGCRDGSRIAATS